MYAHIFFFIKNAHKNSPKTPDGKNSQPKNFQAAKSPGRKNAKTANLFIADILPLRVTKMPMHFQT